MPGALRVYLKVSAATSVLVGLIMATRSCAIDRQVVVVTEVNVDRKAASPISIVAQLL